MQSVALWDCSEVLLVQHWGVQRAGPCTSLFACGCVSSGHVMHCVATKISELHNQVSVPSLSCRNMDSKDAPTRQQLHASCVVQVMCGAALRCLCRHDWLVSPLRLLLPQRSLTSRVLEFGSRLGVLTARLSSRRSNDIVDTINAASRVRQGGATVIAIGIGESTVSQARTEPGKNRAGQGPSRARTPRNGQGGHEPGKEGQLTPSVMTTPGSVDPLGQVTSRVSAPPGHSTPVSMHTPTVTLICGVTFSPGSVDTQSISPPPRQSQ